MLFRNHSEVAKNGPKEHASLRFLNVNTRHILYSFPSCSLISLALPHLRNLAFIALPIVALNYQYDLFPHFIKISNQISPR